MEIKTISQLNELEYEIIIQTSEGIESIIALADTLVELQLLKPQRITLTQYQLLKQNYATVYRQAIQYLSYRQRSCAEVVSYLREKDHEEQQIAKVIERLQQQRYLDDQLFARSYVRTAFLDVKQGPNKVKQTLQQKFQIDALAIEEALTEYSEEIQRQNIVQLLAKLVRTNKKYAGRALEQQLFQKMRSYGYPLALVQLIWQEEQSEDTSAEVDDSLFLAQAEKVYRRLQRETDSYKKRQKFIQKMYQLGFSTEQSQNWFIKQEENCDETN